MGTDKQVQYNDNGKTAGAEMYYAKSTKNFGVTTDVPSYLFHVKDSRTDYLVGVHNTSTSYLSRGMIVRADGGDPFAVQTGDGNFAFGIDRNKNTYMYGNVIATGSVAIGGVFPSFTLTVNGTAGKPGGGTWSATSDKRLKNTVSTLENSLDKITRLKGVTFQWINPDEHGGETGVQAGFLAQDVEEIFPEWVSEIEPVGKDKELVDEHEKIKALYFPHGFNAYLVEAIKELRTENESLKKLVCLDHPDAALCK